MPTYQDMAIFVLTTKMMTQLIALPPVHARGVLLNIIIQRKRALLLTLLSAHLVRAVGRGSHSVYACVCISVHVSVLPRVNNKEGKRVLNVL